MLTNLSYNDHVKYFINDVPYGISTDPSRTYRLEFGSIDYDYYKKSNYYEELKRVADIQYKLFGKDLIVFLSGGLDSEIVVRSFLNIGINPRCVIIRFINELNSGKIENYDEVSAAIKTADILGVSYEFHDIDVLKFYTSGEAKELAIKYTCSEFAILVFYKVYMTFASYPCIFCSEILLEKRRDKDLNPAWYIKYEETFEAATYRVYKDTGVPIVMEWYFYTPELMLYFLESSEIKNLVNNRSQHVSTNKIKNDILRRLMPDVKDSTKIKTWGYGNLSNLVLEAIWQFKYAMPYRIDPTNHGASYNEVIKMLKG